MMADTPFIRIRNLSKRYTGVEALKSVSFDIHAGRVHALIGENGAGKSTLIKILAGAVQPDPGGEIYYCGERYTPQTPKDAMRKGVATIYQIMNLLPDRSIMHNIMLGREQSRNGILDFTVMRKRTSELLDMLNAGYLNVNEPVGELKVGEKQVVEIARALVNESRFLIMDEATAALNQTEMDALFANIRQLREHGVTILYVSHRLDEIFALADDVTVLRDGQHIFTGDVKEVTREQLIFHMIGRKLSSIFPERRVLPGEEILRVEGLGSENSLWDISFSLHRGEVLAVTGLSGCGKADLGKVLYGALPHNSGRIFLNGQPFKPTPAHAIRSGIILLPEDRKVDSMLQDLNIRRNISLSVLNSRAANRFGVIDHAREHAIAETQMRALDIKATSMEQVVMYLSGGNQQKVALGRCLAVDPHIYILLEPTQGLDVGVKFEIYKFINDHAARGKAILLITSELAEVIGLSQRVLVMHEGHIAATLVTDQTNQQEIMHYALGELETTEKAQ